MTLDNDVARLARTRPFSLLPREAVQLVAFSCRKRRLKAGDVLFHADEPGDEGYFLHSGAVLLAKRAAAGRRKARDGGRAHRRERALRAGGPAGRGARRRGRGRHRRFAGDLPARSGGVSGRSRQGARRARRARPASRRRARRRTRIRSLDAVGRKPEAPRDRRGKPGSGGCSAPTLADIEALADAAFAQLPATLSPPLRGPRDPGRRFPRRRDARRDGGRDRVRPARPLPRPRPARPRRCAGDGRAAQHDLALPPSPARLSGATETTRSRPSSPMCSCTRSATTSASRDADMEAIEREAR